MSGLSFANPWILAALPAAGIPILIHFLTRSRPRRIAFPPFKFLAEACAGQQAIHRLRAIILLTVRALAVLALILFFARPFLKPTGAAATPEAAKRAVILLDASLSMRAVQNGASLFARAQSEAADALKSLDDGAEAAIILAGAQPRTLLPALSRNLSALHDALVQSQPGCEAGNPAAALALAKKLLDGRGTVFVFSDFQKSNWEGVELPAGMVCRLRQVADSPVDNMALVGARLSPSDPVAGEDVEIVCPVLNSSPNPRRQTVRLELGEVAQETQVSVPPYSTADAVFHVAFAKPGPVTGKATLPPDDLREDNTRYFALQVRNTLQLLLISDSDRDDSRSPVFFVARALSPSPQSTPGLALIRRHSQQADRGVLETADAFALVSPAVLSGEAAEIIARRVNDGAFLMVFLDGPQATTLLLPPFNPPFQLIRSMSIEDTLSPGPRKLFEDAEADWSAVPLGRHWQNRILPGREEEALLFYSDHSVALAITPLGKGAVVHANLPLTPDVSSLPGSPLFPSLLQELLRLSRKSPAERAVAPGAAWMLDVPVSGEGAIAVLDPEGRPVEAKPVSSGRTVRLAMPNAVLPGIYTASQNGALAAAGAVNIDPRESDTRPIAIEQIKAPKDTVVTVARNEEDLLIEGRTRPLWPHFGALAAGLLMTEMILLALWRRVPVDARRTESRKEASA